MEFSAMEEVFYPLLLVTFLCFHSLFWSDWRSFIPRSLPFSVFHVLPLSEWRNAFIYYNKVDTSRVFHKIAQNPPLCYTDKKTKWEESCYDLPILRTSDGERYPAQPRRQLFSAWRWDCIQYHFPYQTIFQKVKRHQPPARSLGTDPHMACCVLLPQLQKAYHRIWAGVIVIFLDSDREMCYFNFVNTAVIEQRLR